MSTKPRWIRLLSLVLSCVLTLQLLPAVQVWATEETSGTCGENLVWELAGDTLVIDGEGAMYDYGDIYDEDGNWVDVKVTPWGGRYVNLVLDDRITYIGAEAFQGTQIESIELPSELKSIGRNAFAYSGNLKEVSLPEGLETMGTSVFWGGTALETVSIPSTLKVIPNETFYDCQKLVNVTIAEGVEEIGESAFLGCGINRIEIPGSVKQIEMSAFARNSKLTELVLNDGLEKIGDSVFQGCNSLWEVTIPSTVQAVGDYAFMPGPSDVWLGDNSFIWKNPEGMMNLYVLSKDLSLYSTNMWGETTDLWTVYSTTIHAYADSRMAQEIETYNAEISEDMVENRITFYPLTEGEHSFSDWAKMDEETHSRTCGDCDAEEVRPHTLVIDMDNYTLRSCEEDERYRWVCTACDYAGEFYTDPAWVATGHSLSDSYTQYEDYHTIWCYNCSEDVQLPHEWSYVSDPTATGPYEVEALCTVCMYQRVITVIPAGATIITVKAQDENGDTVELPDGSYTVRWEDSAGNVLAQGSSYVHAESWNVDAEHPVIAVITFSDELQQAYSVGGEVRQTVTELGVVTEYLLTPRGPLNVMGKLKLEGRTYLPVSDVTLTLTTTVAGVETVQTIEPDIYGNFTATIRRAPTKLEFRCTGYASLTLDNIQMIPEAEGTIDLGTITLADTMASEYMTAIYTDPELMDLAKQLAESEAVMTAVNERTGEVYDGVRIAPVAPSSQPEQGYRFCISFGAEMDLYFQPGDSVTVRLDKTGEIGMVPVTFPIARKGEEQPVPAELYRTPRLDVRMNHVANLYIFDSEGNIVHSKIGTKCNARLERGTYTIICFEENYTIPTIDSPETFVQMNVPENRYIRQTIELTSDLSLEYEVPLFMTGKNIAVAADFDTDLMDSGLVPMTVIFNEYYVDGYENGEQLRFEFYVTRNNFEMPIKSVGGTYAFGAPELNLQSEMTVDEYDEQKKNMLVVTADQPRGQFTLYVKPTGQNIGLNVENGRGEWEFIYIQLPDIARDVKIVGLSGTRSNPDGRFFLYTKLAEEYAPYTAQLYVNSELKSETELNIKGEGKNIIDLKLKNYNDGNSTHNVQVTILDKDGNVFWSSPNHMVILTNDSLATNEPSTLNMRINWLGGAYESILINKTIDLKNEPSAYINLSIWPDRMNEGSILDVDLVCDYALKMDDNSRIKNGVVYMKVYCNETGLEPTIHTVKLRYNELSDSFEGTLTLRAGTYGVRDMPYGYSFDYITTRAGSGEPERPPFSAEQLVDTLEQQAAQREQWANEMQSNVFEFYDPDDVEFTLENTEGLTDEEKEMFRVLLSISNDLYTLREEATQNNAAVVADRYGEDVLSDSPVESVQKITDSVSNQMECEFIPEGSTSEEALLEAGFEEINTSYGDFHLNIDESGAATVVDLQNNLSTSVSVDYTGQDLETAISTYAPTFFSAVHAMLDAAIGATEKVSDYYSNQLIRKLGLEGNIDQLDDMIAKYKTYLGLLEDPITWKSGDYGKDLKTISLEIAEELEEIDLTRQQIEQFKRTLTTLKADLVQTEKSIRLATLERPNLQKNLQQVKFLNSGAGKVLGFIGLDLYGIVVSVIGVVDAVDVARDRENTIENSLKNADRMIAFSNAAAECTGFTPADTCQEVYEEYIAEGEDAKDWNTAWFCTKIGQAIGSVGSVAVGAFVKGVPGIIASLAIGIVGGGAEAISLNGFNDSLEDMQEIWLEFESNCIKEYELDDAEQDCVSEKLDRGSEEEDGETGAGNLPDDGSNVPDSPEYPIVIKPHIDPAGYVYEAVASNRIEGATAKIYYEGENGEEVYWSDAPLYGEINPQITDSEGRFAWMTPIGNWRVKITMDGYEDADSKNDPAAVDGWLPVPPPQLDVNIGLISTAAPTVLSAGAAPDQIRVVFSQYMDVAQFGVGMVQVTQDGKILPVRITFEDAEPSPVDETVVYGRTMTLVRHDGQPFDGENIRVRISGTAKNYAGRILGSDYTSQALTVEQLVGSLSHSYPNRFVTDIAGLEQVAVQVLDTQGKPMAGVTVTAHQKTGGTMELNTSAVSDANGTAVFTVKGIRSGYDVITFTADPVSVEMNTRVSPLGRTAPQKPTANLTDYAVVNKGTELILTYPGTEEDVVIYYTTDDTCPCTDGDGRMIYTGPIVLTKDTFFRIAAWTKDGGYSERLNLHITVIDNSRTVTYAPNGGSGAMDADVVEAGTVYTLRECTFTAPAGHRFGGWSVNGTTMQPGDQITVTEDTVISALWEAIVYRLTVTGGYAVANGIEPVTGAIMGTTVTLIADQMSETQKFVKWSVTGAEVEDETESTTTFVMPDGEVTAVAVYEQIHLCRNHLTRIDAKPASCTQDGNIAYYLCSCGKYYEDTSASVEITDKESVILPAGHTEEILPAVDPTCTEPGMTEGRKCSVCGEILVRQKRIEALGHVWKGTGCTRCGGTRENPFQDVPEDSFFIDPVLWAVENGITTGATGNTFDPGGDLLRAQVVTMLWRAAGEPVPALTENPFTDIKETDFYYTAVLWAVEQGITTGVSATRFDPFGLTNRAQAITFLWRYLGKPDAGSGNPFDDVDADAWYGKAILWASANGITNGMTQTQFGITINCNRAHMVTFLYRALD